MIGGKVDIALVAQFWLIAILLTLTPGADWAFAIGAGLRSRSVAPAVLGMVSGYAIVIACVAFGLGTLVTRFPMILAVLTIAGAAYLVFLGIGALLGSAPELQTAGGAATGLGAGAQFLRGVGVSGLNPKGVLLLIALLPQFTSATSGWPSATQMLALGGLHLLNIAVVYFAVGVLARRLLGTRPRAGHFVAKASGVIMIVIGISILVEKLLV